MIERQRKAFQAVDEETSRRDAAAAREDWDAWQEHDAERDRLLRLARGINRTFVYNRDTGACYCRECLTGSETDAPDPEQYEDTPDRHAVYCENCGAARDAIDVTITMTDGGRFHVSTSSPDVYLSHSSYSDALACAHREAERRGAHVADSVPPIERMAHEVGELLIALRSDVHCDSRASDDPDDDRPAMCVTISLCPEHAENWNYQTGDNSYTGACYGDPYWGVGDVAREDSDADCKQEATRMVEEIREQIANGR